MGGVAAVHQRINQELARAQASSGIELVGMLATNRPPDAVEHPPEGIPLLVPPAAKSDERTWYLEMLRQIDPDIVLFHHLGYRWSQWHLQTDVPFAGVIHSWVQLKHSSPDKSQRARQILDALLPSANALIFPSEHLINEGRTLIVPYPDSVLVIPNPLDTVFISEKSGAGLPDRPNNRLILSVGSTIPRKRHELVLRAAAVLGHDVEIIGDGPNLVDLRELAASIGLGSRVRFSGFQSAEYVASRMRSADLLCVPSSSEPFGNVYIEALASGLPVVGFAPSIEEIANIMGVEIGRGVSGDASLGEVTAAIHRVLSTRWNRDVLKKRAESCFSPVRIGQRYAAALAGAVDPS